MNEETGSGPGGAEERPPRGGLWILTADRRAAHLIRGTLTSTLGLEVQRLSELTAEDGDATEVAAFAGRLATWLRGEVARLGIDRIHAFVEQSLAAALDHELPERERARLVDEPLVLERLLPAELRVHETIAALGKRTDADFASGPGKGEGEGPT